jgi:aquaporin Z
MSEMKKYVAEMLGSMTLIIVGVGALLGFGLNGLVGVALAFGIIVMALIYTIGPISGCHINPAVTIGVMAIKGMKVKEGVMYIIFQVIGAIIGGVALWLVVSDWGSVSGTTVSAAFQGVSCFWATSGNHMLSAFMVEFLIAMVLQLVILGSLGNKDAKVNAGIAIGLVVSALLFVAGPIDNAGLNPLRDLAPAIFAGGKALEQLWLFILAPIIGAIVGSFVFAWFAKPDKA